MMLVCSCHGSTLLFHVIQKAFKDFCFLFSPVSACKIFIFIYIFAGT